MKYAIIVALLTTLPFPAFAERDPARCEYLRKEVERIDAQARQRSTTALQVRRQKAMDEMYQLRCSRMAR